LEKKKIDTKERRCLDVHGGCWMDGWMKDIQLTSAMPQPPSVTTSVASFKFKRRAVATPSNAALAFAPSCLHCGYASLTHAPFKILPPALARY
jgi:hypothetical protein